MLAHFGGVAQDISWPGTFDKFVNLHVDGIQYTLTRLVILGIGLVDRRRRCGSGSSARAPAWSSARASTTATWSRRWASTSSSRSRSPSSSARRWPGLGGVIGGSFASLAPGVDANWLLNSLVVVIIGGMGSLGGAAIGVAAARPDDELRRRLPAGGLHLLLDHLHVRPAGDRARRPSPRALRAARMSAARSSRLTPIASPARCFVVARRLRAADLHRVLGRGAADADAVPGHRRREPDLPVGLRRDGLAGAGRDLRRRRLRARQPDDQRQHEGPEPRLGRGARASSSRSSSPCSSRSSSARWPAAATGSTS